MNLPIRPAQPAAVPPGYTEVLYWKLTDQPARVLKLQVLSIPLFLVFCLLYGGMAAALQQTRQTLALGPVQMLRQLAAVLLTLVLHELIHGLGMRLYGARPRYGVLLKQMMFYATAPGYGFRRGAYLVVALAPLVVISLAAAAGMVVLSARPGGAAWVALLALCAACNGGGAIGDLWISQIVRSYPPEAYIVDEQDGVRIFLPASQAGDI